MNVQGSAAQIHLESAASSSLAEKTTSSEAVLRHKEVFANLSTDTLIRGQQLLNSYFYEDCSNLGDFHKRLVVLKRSFVPMPRAAALNAAAIARIRECKPTASNLKVVLGVSVPEKPSIDHALVKIIDALQAGSRKRSRLN